MTKTDLPPATEGIESLQQLRDRLAAHLAALETGINAAQEQWSQLGRLGAQRDDHAADLLEKQVYRPLANIATFSARCVEQIDAYCGL